MLLTLLSLEGCGPGGPGPVVVFCSPDSPRMRQAVQGFTANLGAGPVEVISVPEFGVELKERLRQVRRQRPRLLVALGTPALMEVAQLEKRIPVVFALVGNPYFTDAAPEPQHPELHQENLTGLATPAPVRAALQQGAALLGGGTWGLLYDPNDGVAAELARTFTREAPNYRITPVTAESAAAPGDGPALAGLLAKGARVIYLPPAASAARYAPMLLQMGRDLKVRVVSSFPEGDPKGAALRVALDYRQVGEEAAALARRVLAGEAPRDIPITETQPLRVEADDTLLRRWSGYPPPKWTPKKYAPTKEPRTQGGT